MIFKNKKLFFLFVLTSLFLVTSADAFTISPLKYTASLGPSDSTDFVVSVKNDSNSSKEYEASVVGLLQDSLGRSVFKKNSDIAESWVKYNIQKINLKSGEKKDFVFTINVPKNTPPGAHYLGIGAQEISGLNIGSRLLTSVVLQVAGTANESLVLEKFYPIKKYFFNNEFLYFFQIKNIGNIDLSLKGQIETYDFKNKLINSRTINLGNKLFSQSVRASKISTGSTDKIIWPGKYRSIFILNYGITNQQIVGSANFWYCPTWFLSLSAITIFFAVLLVIYKRKKHERME